jgi:hypothetical protein
MHFHIYAYFEVIAIGSAMALFLKIKETMNLCYAVIVNSNYLCKLQSVNTFEKFAVFR